MSLPSSGSPAATAYGGALICSLAALLLRLILQPLLGDVAFQVFMLAVAASALWGLGPGLLASALCAGLGHALLHPRTPLALPALLDDPRALLFFIEGAAVSGVVAAARRQVRIERAARQERVEESLREAAADTRAILDCALDAVIGMDEQGAVTFWNPRAAEIFGWTEKEALGRRLAELILRPGDRAAFGEALARALERGEADAPGRRVELLALRRDRSHFPATMSTAVRARGAQRHFTAFVADITEHTQALAAEHEARREAEDANRAKDEFLATISHELRTPLTAIVGWAQILRAGSLSEEDCEKALASIERNARAQAQLISDLLDVSRIVTGKLHLELRPLMPVQVVEAALDTVRPTASAKGVELAAELDRGVGMVAGDAHRLQQVVWNLLANAIKFTPRGGRVRVRLAREAEHVVMAVEDTGAGIKPEFLPHVFERFRQADVSAARMHGGLGLGLAIVSHLVEAHGGSVAAHSDGPGLGSTFTVRLPLAAAGERAPARERQHQAADQAALAGLRVLVVDDAPDIRDMMRTVLTLRGAEVHMAASAQGALDALAHGRFDVLVSDLEMPETDGYELMRAVRRLPDAGTLPAAALTAYARPEDRTEALRAGYQLHLVKPIEPEALVEAVAGLAGRPAALAAPPDRAPGVQGRAR
jgi:PAS domain S-box-containing protein